MGWNRWYVARSYVRTALWMVPLVALMLEQLTIRIVASIDDRVDRVLLIGATGEGTLGQMGTVVTLSVSFIVFTFGSMLAAIQVASGQLTPRIIATTLLRDNVIRATVGLFAFTLLFAAGLKPLRYTLTALRPHRGCMRRLPATHSPVDATAACS
jgi:uncharacterized membrane protein